ncbi:MAG: iron-sulfur cluster carrier protein ApbC [Gammaproteobacteria bacterium]|nr:iron-sulfur cluster carrier protein ApbC [Gammaproteobacteria bacterium]
MSTEREALLRQSIGGYIEPYIGLSLEELGAVRSVRVTEKGVDVSLELPIPASHYGAELAAALKARLSGVAGDSDIRVDVAWNVAAREVRSGLKPIQGIRNIIAVASGKGGVGKSTTAANLALALAREGAAVGLLDADIYGPSQPTMMGLKNERPASPDQRTMIPPVAYGVKVMSIGFLIDEEQPMVWRGPMVTQALVQLLETTRWGDLDYLIVDMPPGTGDTQLTLSQRVPVSGAVIVSTPQDIALLDARKGLRMFQKVEVPVLGIVENMSTHVCSKCGHEEHVFGAGGGRRMAEQYGVPLLAELPLDIRIREQTDSGKPTVVAEPDSQLGRAYLELARRAAGALARAIIAGPAAFPTIRIEDT